MQMSSMETVCKTPPTSLPIFTEKLLQLCYITLHAGSDLIIPGLVTIGTAKICCRGLILALFYSTEVIKNDFG